MASSAHFRPRVDTVQAVLTHKANKYKIAKLRAHLEKRTNKIWSRIGGLYSFSIKFDCSDGRQMRNTSQLESKMWHSRN